MPDRSAGEAALIERARDGDVDAFAAFIRGSERRLRAVLGRLLDDQRDVDEALQDTYLSVWRSLSTFRGQAAVETWTYRIAVNAALARKRRARLDTMTLDAVAEVADAPGAGPEIQAETKEFSAFITASVRLLTPEFRSALVLRDVAGLSNQEVADALEISLAAAKSRIHRARMALAERVIAWNTGTSANDGDVGPEAGDRKPEGLVEGHGPT